MNIKRIIKVYGKCMDARLENETIQTLLRYASNDKGIDKAFSHGASLNVDMARAIDKIVDGGWLEDDEDIDKLKAAARLLEQEQIGTDNPYSHICCKEELDNLKALIGMGYTLGHKAVDALEKLPARYLVAIQELAKEDANSDHLILYILQAIMIACETGELGGKDMHALFFKA